MKMLNPPTQEAFVKIPPQLIDDLLSGDPRRKKDAEIEIYIHRTICWGEFNETVKDKYGNLHEVKLTAGEAMIQVRRIAEKFRVDKARVRAIIKRLINSGKLVFDRSLCYNYRIYKFQPTETGISNPQRNAEIVEENGSLIPAVKPTETGISNPQLIDKALIDIKNSLAELSFGNFNLTERQSNDLCNMLDSELSLSGDRILRELRYYDE